MNTGIGAIATYAVLTIVWSGVLVLYLRHRREASGDPLIRLLLSVLVLDAFKSVVESVYFGLVWSSNYGLLGDAFKVLSHPAPLTAVKLLNLSVAAVVLARIARQWVPGELARRAKQRADEARLREELERNLRRTREAEERLRLAMRNSRALIWEADLETGSMESSPELATWLGYQPHEWPPPSFRALIHPDDLPRLLEALGAVQRGEQQTYELRHRMLRKDGAELWAHSTGGPVHRAGDRPTRFVGVVRDVTRDVEAEANRVQTQKLESLGLLAGGIAHDFNNLLTVIASSLELADRNGKRGAPITEPIATANLAVTHASVLTRQLLAYAGRSTLAQRPLDLNELVESMGQLLSVSVPRKVKLVHALGDRLPLVKGDEGQLQQVVMNLITNAAEAIGDGGGTVTLSTEAVTLHEPPPGATGAIPLGRAVCLRVADTGAGMSPEVQARIFDPFFSTKGLGRGLGLAALAGILRSHSAAIAIESAVGQGTTVSVFFPALPDVAAAAGWASQREVAGAPLACRVLLVDDEELLRRSAGRLLKTMGCTVEEAATGREAVERVRATPSAFDVVLMDLTMPEMGGAEAAAALESIAPTLPIILSSGYSATDVVKTEGRIFALAKPYTAAALEATLREAMQRKG